MSGNTRNVINMANSIVGVSILSMPYCFKEAGLVLATILVLFSGLLTKKTCMYLIRSAMMARRRSYELLAFQAFGVGGKLLMELCLICFLIGICISFHVVMGDLAPSIVANYMNIGNSPSLRGTILSGIVLLVILPLCLLRNIDSLASMSACSIGFYVFLNSIVFYAALPRLLDGSWLSMVKLWEVKKAFHVLPIMSLALSCQSNVFEIYDSLPDPDITKMKWVVGQAVNLCCALYIGVGSLGYIAFADVGIGGNIIMSFPNSGLTDCIKMLFVISLAISFPLMLFPCRTSIHSLFYRSVSQVSYTDLVGNYMPELRFRIITFGVLVFSLFIGILLPNIEFVLGLLGSTMGMLISIILPSVFFIKVYTKLSADRILAQALLLFGLFIMVTGTFIHLHSFGLPNEAVIAKSQIKKLTDDEAKMIPNIPENVAINNENLAVRKEPAIPQPPHIPLPEVKKESELDPNLVSVPAKKIKSESVSAKAIIVNALPESDGLHPDAIKHEDKEKAVEDIQKQVIEQKQEKILNYIEEQQKKQNEMLEILHELKDKTDQKGEVKPGSVVIPKVANSNVHAPSNLTNINDKVVPIKLPDSPKKPINHRNVILSQIETNTHKINKVVANSPAAEVKLNASSVPAPSKPREVVKILAVENRISNKSNKHDEERKRRDLKEIDGDVKLEDIFGGNEVLRDAAKLQNVPNSNLNEEIGKGLFESDGMRSMLGKDNVETRRLLSNDIKIRRRKKHDGQEYWDEM